MGLNFLVHRDGGPDDSIVFQDIANDLNGTGSIRFPGGTVAEVGVQRIDANGNTYYAELPLDISVTNGNLATSTSSFLESAAQNGWDVTIVLPMWRFLNVDTMEIDENASGEISAYVAAVIAEASRLGVTISGFELGNEWDILSYRTNDDHSLTRAEAAEFSSAYAILAAEFAVAIQAEISGAENSSGVGIYTEESEPFIAIQTLWAWMNNSSGFAEDFEAAIRSAFTTSSGAPNAAQDAVDTVLAHFYLWQPGGGGEVEDPSAAYFLRNMEDISAIFGGDLDYLISEWNLQMNVNGGAQPDVNSADGIQQLEPIVALFHTMISEGVDYANFWAVRESSWNSLYGLEIQNGMSQYVRPVRFLFDLLSDQLMGTQAIDMNGAISGNMANIGDDIHVYGFANNDRTVVYFGSRSENNQSINLDLHNFTITPENTLIQITRISVDDPSLASYRQTTTVTTEEYTFDQFQALEGDFLTFSPYELISIEIIYHVGPGEIETGTNARDLMFGTAADDIFFGSVGADDIFGYFGMDTVDYSESTESVSVFLDTNHGTNSGGDAEGDVLTSIENVTGSSYDDIISGDDNSNVLNGGGGDDILRGGLGDDIILPGEGVNSIDGGLGIDTISYQDLSSGIYVSLVEGVAGNETNRDEIEGVENIIGTEYADQIMGDFNNNELYGLDGNDTIRSLSGHDIIYAGDGDDFVETYESVVSVHGGNGNDTIIAHNGVITAYGGDGDDRIIAGTGNDIIEGGAGSDRLTGGDGNDVFIFSLDSGHDVITDFNIYEDSLSFNYPSNSEEWQLVDGVDGVTLILNENNSILFQGVSALELEASQLL